MSGAESQDTQGRSAGETARQRTGSSVAHKTSDVESMTSEEIFTYPTNDNLILGTAAIQVGDEIWIGGIAGGVRIARISVP